MKAIKPISITDAMLTSSNVTENDYTEYIPGTIYGVGDLVIITTVGIHKVYESLRAANHNNYPPSNLTGGNPYWLEVGATNRWKMFDYLVQSQTENTSVIKVVLAPGESINSIALLHLDASSVRITMTDPVAAVVYDKTILLSASEIVLWETLTVWSAEYIWQGGVYNDLVEKVALKTDLPNYPNASLTIIIASSGVTAKCGVLVIGNYIDLGNTRYSPAAGIRDYSIKEADDYGNFTILERAYSKRVSVSFFMDTSEHSRVLRFLTHYRATALVWILSEMYNLTIAYGFYKSFSISVPNLTHSECDIEIEGLT